jgi:hypothetical protein
MLSVYELKPLGDNMILIHLIVGMTIMFVAGMHFAEFHRTRIKNAFFWSVALTGLGLYTFVSLIGRVSAI